MKKCVPGIYYTFCLECVGHIRGFFSNGIPCLSCVPDRQDLFSYNTLTLNTVLAERVHKDSHSVLALWVQSSGFFIISILRFNSSISYQSRSQNGLGQDLFCCTGLTRQLVVKEWDSGCKPRAPLESTTLQTRGCKCHLDGNQMRIKYGPTLVCFQEVSQLATEEVSIFRQMEPADHLSSQFRVKSLCVCVHKMNWLFVPILVCLRMCLSWGC